MRKKKLLSLILVSMLLTACDNQEQPHEVTSASVETMVSQTAQETVIEEIEIEYPCHIVAAGSAQTVAIKKDGTVCCTEYTELPADCNYAVDVADWKDIISVDSKGGLVVGLSSSGDVNIMNNNTLKYVCKTLHDVKLVTAIGTGILYVDKDNRPKQLNQYQENTIQLLSMLGKSKGIIYAGNSVVSLNIDDTISVIPATEYSGDVFYDVKGWSNIIKMTGNDFCIVGLTKSGKVVGYGNNDKGQLDVDEWCDIIDISCGNDFTVGLKRDGTVIATGNNEYGQCDVSDWNDIVAIVCGNEHTVGIKKDGTAVAVGNNKYGQCNVSDWKDLKVN